MVMGFIDLLLFKREFKVKRGEVSFFLFKDGRSIWVLEKGKCSLLWCKGKKDIFK